MAEWLAIDEDWDPNFEEDDTVWRVLDDADMSNFGAEWQCVFDMLPELACTGLRHAPEEDPGWKKRIDDLRRQLRE